ncbi:hypothetical protein QUF80_10730 [Desulfococcaceae bacterium HSG8]|nr:hypothetical protein [Desulfococcaceae bacterium HSG8]
MSEKIGTGQGTYLRDFPKNKLPENVGWAERSVTHHRIIRQQRWWVPLALHHPTFSGIGYFIYWEFPKAISNKKHTELKFAVQAEGGTTNYIWYGIFFSGNHLSAKLKVCAYTPWQTESLAGSCPREARTLTILLPYIIKIT